MKATIVKEFRFEAAHMLPNHDGKCRGLHGHSYRVQIGVRGEVKPANGDPDEGMVIDFTRVSEAFRDHVHARLDHKYLNDVIAGPTTAERIASWILFEMCGAGVCPSFVRVWETATGFAEVEG